MTDFLLNPSQDPDKLLFYNRVLTAEPVDQSQQYQFVPDNNQTYQVPQKYDFSNNLDADIVIIYLALRDFGNIVLLLKEISITLIFGDGPPPIQLEDVRDDFDAAQNEYNERFPNLGEVEQSVYREPSLFNFDLEEYLEYIRKSDWRGLSEAETDKRTELAVAYNGKTEDASSLRLSAFIRIFCELKVLFFVGIQIG